MLSTKEISAYGIEIVEIVEFYKIFIVFQWLGIIYEKLL